MSRIPNPAYLAISEAISFHRYKQQNDILVILDQAPIEWESLVPAPSVSLKDAEAHVGKVCEACGIRMQEGESVMAELKVRQERTGQASIVIEVDGYPYKLALADLISLSDEQKQSLIRLQQHTGIIRDLTQLLDRTDLYIPTPQDTTPTPTTNLPAAPAALPVPATWVLAARLTPRFVGAAIKIEIALWMLTRGLPISDWRYWAFVGVGIGWWLWECLGIFRTERRRLNGLARAQGMEDQRNAPRNEGPAENGELRGPGPAGLPDPGRRTNTASRRNARKPNPIPLFGLAYERRCLRLFYYDPASTRPVISATDHRIPRRDQNLPLAPPEPGFLWIYIVMPLYVLLLSLWPDGDNARRAAIREREVHMRLLSQKLTEAERQDRVTTSTTGSATADATGASTINESTSTRDSSWVTEPSEEPTVQPVIPKGLGPRAQQYWARVLERGETIDWDEERAAQAELLGRAGGAQPAEEEQMGFF
ncbi:hypothetical protein NliqN6_1124 [Naganishia liquefaciens]|uniref:Uncharacterized protein n=1 Tax=Naganishia liquefaciens TaxID=104408 RepID=A0A8H3TP88_9TREE|nr:hypothetical protein NliqN6_1124 [Naganishia liquefaciens]